MTHTTNIHIDAGDVVSAVELATATPCDVVNIAAEITVFVGPANAAVILQLSQVLRAAALKHGATETGEDESMAAAS